MTTPRTWPRSSDPDSDTTHVRDAFGVVWRRGGPNFWWGDAIDGISREWPNLLVRGPLTDVSAEYGEESGRG